MAAGEGVAEGDAVGEFEAAACGQTGGEPGDADSGVFQNGGDVEGGGFAFDVGAEGKNDFGGFAFLKTRLEGVDGKLFRADAVQR